MPTPKITEETASIVIEHHFGIKPKEIKQLTGGLANFVFEAKVESERFIIRMCDLPLKLEYYQKEQWAVNAAREKGVPIPEILETGNTAVPFPYMISRKVESEARPALTHPDKNKIIFEMGRYAAIINTIKTEGFGNVFNWSNNTLSKHLTWKDYFNEYLYNEVGVGDRLEIFEKAKVLEPENMKILKKKIQAMEKWDVKPTLNHCDIRLKNMIVNYEGEIAAVLDWENCMSNAAPYWEVSIALHDLGVDEKDIFLDGYGMKPKEYREIAEDLKVINILNYATYMKFLLENKDTKTLDKYKTRLNGGLDLYSFK